MSVTALLLGIISIFIFIAIMLLVGYLVRWLLLLVTGVAIDPMVQKMYLVIVGLMALYALVALLFGLPLPFHWRL